MAFIIRRRLQPDRNDVTLPVTITFTATLKDDEASKPPQSSTLTLTLADSNGLTFKPNGDKSQPFQRSVPSGDKELSFTATIQGDPGDAGSFRVALVLPDGQQSGCLVNLA